LGSSFPFSERYRTSIGIIQTQNKEFAKVDIRGLYEPYRTDPADKLPIYSYDFKAINSGWFSMI
jgi:hypothetical protein